jgi:hypothetical protein
MTSGKYARLVRNDSLKVAMLEASTSPVALRIKRWAKKRWTEKKAR